MEAAASSVLDMTVNASTLSAGSQATYSYDEETNTATFGIPQGEAGAGAAGVTASAYSSSRTYAVGDYVIHNSNLYRCTTAITTAEAFTAAHWTQVVLADDVTDLKSDINDIETFGFVTEYHTFLVDDIPNVDKVVGYYDSGGSLVANATYSTYFVVADESFDVYTNQINGAYLSLAIYSDKQMTTTIKSRIRHLSGGSWDGFPTVSSPLHINKGEVLCITIAATDTVTEYSTNELKYGSKLYDAVRMSKDIQDYIDAGDEPIDLIFRDKGIATNISQISGVVKKAGTSGSADGTTAISLSNNANYDSYYYIVPNDIDVFFNTSEFAEHYVALCYGYDYTGIEEHSTSIDILCSNSVRKRTSENNLPTEASPVSLSAGDVFAVTVPSGITVNIYGVETEKAVKQSFAEEVISASGDKSLYIQYKTGSGIEFSSEWVEVFVPAKVGYVRYRFVHTENNAINADVWKVGDAYAVSDSFADRFALTTSGEWECAIKLDGASDFAGGSAHGDEVLIDDPAFFVDGALVDITTFTTRTAVKSFSVSEHSNLYNPDNQAQIFAYHGSEHIFNTDGLEIRQSVLWLVAKQLSNCYLAMLPIAKAVSDRYFTDRFFADTAIGGTAHTEVGATYSKIYGENNGVSCVFEVPKYSPKSMYFFMTDNGGTLYNKCYFAVNNTTPTANSDLWESITKYKFEIAS